MIESMHMGGYSDSPLSRVLTELSKNGKPKRVPTGGYMCTCPAHRDSTPSLKVDADDTGKVLLNCKAGCDVKNIVSSLGLELKDLFPDAPESTRTKMRAPAIRLDELCQLRKLPVEFARSMGWSDGNDGVEQVFKRRDGSVYVTRVRRGNSLKDGTYFRPSQQASIAYEPDLGALAKAERYVILVEGETDTVTLLHAGFPALGIPGADLVNKCLLAEHVEGLDRVFYMHEPDAGGEKFTKLVPERLSELGFKGGVHKIQMPETAKDPSALWSRDPQAFAGKLNAVLAAASAPPTPKWRWLSDMVTTVLKPVGTRLLTGFPTLDEATRGGIPLGRFIVFVGAPGAAKTTLSVFLADRWERQGATVCYIAADEPAEGIVMRLGQLSGWSRDALECESEAGEAVRAGFAQRSAGRRIIVLDPDTHSLTLEDAAEALLEAGKDTPKVLVVDSLQQVRCRAAQGLESQRERVDAVVAACKRLAKSGLLVIGISEMSRAGYSGSSTGNISTLAAAKETGGIEYGVALMVGLRSVKGERGVVDLDIAKNRLGSDKPSVRVEIDFHRASLSEIRLPEEQNASQQMEAQQTQRLENLMNRVLNIVATAPAPLRSKNTIVAACGTAKQPTIQAIDRLIYQRKLVEVDGEYRLGDSA